MKINEYGVPDFNYFSLIRRLDGKEVYTSPDYTTENNETDIDKISNTLNYYFVRVNGFVRQQLENPKLTDEQKIQIKILDPRDYDVEYRKFTAVGMARKVFWRKSADVFCKG